MRTIEKIFCNNVKKYYQYAEVDEKASSITILKNKKLIVSITFPIQKLGGDEILRYILCICFNEIEDQWLQYREELLYSPTNAQTLYITTEKFDTEKFDFQGLNLSKYGHQNWDEIFDKLQKEYTIPLVNKYVDIVEVDKLINPINSPIENKIKNSQGYPFRAVLVAQMANNPRLSEIIKDMRKYCQDSYEMGIKDNYVPATKLLPVFEKLFGK
jgi:hypothetical protein